MCFLNLEPTEYPKLNCSLYENTKTVDCYMTQISSTSWNGIPYSYNIVYRVKNNEDYCQNLRLVALNMDLNFQLLNEYNIFLSVYAVTAEKKLYSILL